MGINGQAQYWARDIDEACHILLRHYDHTYVAPGERFPRRAATADPFNRDVQVYPLGRNTNGEEGFELIGEILSDETNPGRKKSFDIRKVMMAVIDQDHAPLERWAGMGSPSAFFCYVENECVVRERQPADQCSPGRTRATLAASYSAELVPLF